MKTIWVPVKSAIVVVKADGKGIQEVDQSIAFEAKSVETPKPGFTIKQSE
jgi:hypothetical protein